MKNVVSISLAAALATAMPWASALAAEFQVKMVNKDSENRMMQFEPAFLKIAPGDSVTFVNADKGHDSESLPDLIPEGADAWAGKINEEITVTFSQEGLYAYRCKPHYALGMVGLIQVGDNKANLDAISGAKLPRKARARMDELTAEVGG